MHEKQTMSNNTDKPAYLMLTPSGVFEAFTQPTATEQQIALQSLLADGQSRLLTDWLVDYSRDWLESFLDAGWVQYVTHQLIAPDVPLDRFLPNVIASLSANRNAAIGSNEGFCLAYTGYSKTIAETLCVAGADFKEFLSRQQQRGWGINTQAVLFHQHIDLLMPTTSFVFLWIEETGYVLVVDEEPLTNSRAFVELVWAIKTAGLRFKR